MSDFQIILITMSLVLFITLILIIGPLIKFYKALFKRTRFEKLGETTKFRLIYQLNACINELSKKKLGAIITIENKQSLENYRIDGIKINADISSDLLLAIFNKYSPLHDGAIVIRGNKIVYAGTFFKITQSSFGNKYGARHRAAIGISEQTDSTTIVVSEETGKVSIVKNAKLTRLPSHKTFQDELTKQLLS